MLLPFWHLDLYGQTLKETERTIYFMRAKQFYGSGAKMDLMINDKFFHKVKSGSRLIMKTNSNDTLCIQIICPIIKGHKSEVIQVNPDSESEEYINLYYWGEGYNPLKHDGVLTGPYGRKPEFNIEIIRMTLNEGKENFNQSERFKDNKKILEKRFVN